MMPNVALDIVLPPCAMRDFSLFPRCRMHKIPCAQSTSLPDYPPPHHPFHSSEKTKKNNKKVLFLCIKKQMYPK